MVTESREDLNFSVTDTVETPDTIEGPVWLTLPTQHATVGEPISFYYAEYVSGADEFWIAHGTADRETSEGTFVYTPTAAGTFTFIIRAVDSETRAYTDQTLTVEVS